MVIKKKLLKIVPIIFIFILIAQFVYPDQKDIKFTVDEELLNKYADAITPVISKGQNIIVFKRLKFFNPFKGNIGSSSRIYSFLIFPIDHGVYCYQIQKAEFKITENGILFKGKVKFDYGNAQSCDSFPFWCTYDGIPAQQIIKEIQYPVSIQYHDNSIFFDLIGEKIYFYVRENLSRINRYEQHQITNININDYFGSTIPLGSNTQVLKLPNGSAKTLTTSIDSYQRSFEEGKLISTVKIKTSN